MSCATIYEELESYARGQHGEPFIQGVCDRALTELHRLLAENSDLHEKTLVLMAENGDLHDELTTLRVSAETAIRLLQLSLPGPGHG